MQSIEGVRVQVIPNTIPSPPLSSAGVWSVAFSVGPAYPQVGRLSSHKVVHLVNDQLKVPLFILGGTLSNTQEDVWSHTGVEKQDEE